MSQNSLEQPVAVAIMCLQPTQSPALVREHIERELGINANAVYVLTSPGGNYGEDLPRLLHTLMTHRKTIKAVVMADHPSHECAAYVAGDAIGRNAAAERIRSDFEMANVPLPPLYEATYATLDTSNLLFRPFAAQAVA